MFVSGMSSVVDLEQLGINIPKLKNYQQWASLGEADENVLLRICYTLDPEILEGKQLCHEASVHKT